LITMQEGKLKGRGVNLSHKLVKPPSPSTKTNYKKLNHTYEY